MYLPWFESVTRTCRAREFALSSSVGIGKVIVKIGLRGRSVAKETIKEARTKVTGFKIKNRATSSQASSLGSSYVMF